MPYYGARNKSKIVSCFSKLLEESLTAVLKTRAFVACSL